MIKSAAVYVDNCGKAVISGNKIHGHDEAIYVANTRETLISDNDILNIETLSHLNELKELILSHEASLEKEIGVDKKNQLFATVQDLTGNNRPSALDRLIAITTLCSNSVTTWPAIKALVLGLISTLTK
ncbi:hypothetical protein [Citrobacter freundii]|uniref:hypothetical protein n=1 Tax=Citrobacter freundii TaxID=546 RepID=UPI001EEF9433|nr:hypothetical protein [Citrobacter freundii]